MDIGYDSTDFQSLLGDILSDAGSNNGDPRSIRSVSSASREAGTKRYKYTLEREKKRVYVARSDGSLMEYEYSLRLPRVLKTDIRRSYANMYINVMNSGDFSLVYGFFDTFCVPAFSNVITRTYKINNEVKTFTAHQRGLFEALLYWYYNLYSVPDAFMMLTASSIVTNESDESMVVSNFAFHATKIYEFPVELICTPFKDSEEIKASIAAKSSESMRSLEANRKRSIDDCCSEGSYVQDALQRSELLTFIKHTVGESFKSFKLKDQPHPIYALGSFTMHLDSQYRITRMDVESKGNPSKCDSSMKLVCPVGISSFKSCHRIILDMMSYSVSSARQIENAIDEHGVAPGGHRMISDEVEAARTSIVHGIYITWVPNPYCTLNGNASDEIRAGTGQCCRVNMYGSMCMCGHTIASHVEIKFDKKGHIRNPICNACRCPGFNYAPRRPEECGQWWLPRRPDFNLETWRERVRTKPEEYACIGCEQKVSDHETIFEQTSHRQKRGAKVGEEYMPLAEHSRLSEQVVEGQARKGGRIRP